MHIAARFRPSDPRFIGCGTGHLMSDSTVHSTLCSLRGRLCVRDMAHDGAEAGGQEGRRAGEQARRQVRHCSTPCTSGMGEQLPADELVVLGAGVTPEICCRNVCRATGEVAAAAGMAGTATRAVSAPAAPALYPATI